MKNHNSLTLALSCLMLFASCSSTNDAAPEALDADPSATEVADTDEDPGTGDALPVTSSSECVPESEGLGADDTFDDAGLEERNSRFVPLNDPVMVQASEVTWLQPDDIVMGISHESGQTQAYPVSQMIYHHVANTSIAGEPYVVTY